MQKPNGIKSIRVIQVIESVAEIGTGIEKDPVRIATQYWGMDGVLLAVIDPLTDLKEPELYKSSAQNQ